MDRYSSFSNGLKNPSQMDGAEDFAMYFGRLKLGTDGNLEPPSQTSNNNASSSSSVSMATKDIKKIKNQSQENQENPVSSPRSIWGHTFFYTDGEDSASNATVKEDFSVDYFKEDTCDFGCSNQPPTMEPFCNFPSQSNCLSQLKNNRFIMPIYDHVSGGFMQTASRGLCYGNYYSTMNNDLSSISKWNQQEIPKPNLEGGNYEWIETMFQFFRSRFLLLMTDHKMSIVFQKLVDACSDEQLQIIVEDVLSSGQMFVDAAFCYPGASSISRLIKKIKRSRYAFSVTKLLSTRFWAIMTNDIARRVVQDCFIHYEHQPNKILYEEAISHFLELAVNKVGCRALNEVINTIASDQRSRLLNNIADHSAYLSNDQYGNYVVQTVLSLKKGDVNARIMVRLRGLFVELAKTTGGSHVVEKCIESSDYGMVSVVEEILEDPRAPLGLALDEFGNYVIQKALKMTKERGFKDVYHCLVRRLQPYHEQLHQTAGGKKVLHLMRNEGWMRYW